ncbi:disulfide bond formation protein [Gracilibacillus boraciitolerans JCM 21714]|uniref:Probable disulfide formation protein n=1 Tax=Gracilibacillus boraciitolerans JCM 21714 TaxID=1298598 RepID=W4VJT0_9BACI|nr:disulfide oxidoreductase [Gracilibacillus boraciitolerans]GAE93665.1 disulfide bond formation protein [Gracilibacillus boraciitolerans JCM 21714]
MDKKRETVFFIIWAQSLVAMMGSLFYSEIMRYIPCELCWYQRILMYPLVVIYGYALYKKDIRFGFPGLILSGIGILVSSYHYLIQKVPSLQSSGDSCGVIPCNTTYVDFLGFITIPFQALIAFLVIFSLHLYLIVQQRRV